MSYENGLFIFRRDLRIVDNIGLNLLNDYCKHVYTIFIFTPEQVGNGNVFKSNNAVQFMIESLEDLSREISKSGGHLYTFYGHNEKIVAECIKEWKIDLVCFNVDISPYAKKRDASIVKLCEHVKTYVMYTYDYYLHQPGTIVNGSGEAYQKFTPYYETAMKKHVDQPANMRKINFSSSNTAISNKITLDKALKKYTKVNPNILVRGGRSNALKVLQTALRTQQQYSKTHNDLTKPTSLLSAYIKFGCLSIREVYKHFHSKTAFIRQLYWRDFYANILHSYPRVLGHSLKSKYDKIKWHHNTRWFNMWCNGTTGFPIIDASMRQLNHTGYMHNRARLIVASFLVKTLLINWQHGEKYFASMLTDYDPASNNGNWQWIMGGGADSQPFYRIFNPWLQTEEYDPSCIYIKTWIPELKDVPSKDILKWETTWMNYKDTGYPKPICNYVEQKEKALQVYKAGLY